MAGLLSSGANAGGLTGMGGKEEIPTVAAWSLMGKLSLWRRFGTLLDRCFAGRGERFCCGAGGG